MDIQRKLTIAKTAITSISRHDDADTKVRDAALQTLKDFIDGEAEAADARVAEKVRAALQAEGGEG